MEFWDDVIDAADQLDSCDELEPSLDEFAKHPCYLAGAFLALWFKLDRIESKLDEQVELIQRLVDVLSSDKSPNLPSFEDVRGIFKRKGGDDAVDNS